MRRPDNGRATKVLSTAALAVSLGACIGDFDRIDDRSVAEHLAPSERPIEPGEYVLVYRDATFYEAVGDEQRTHRGYLDDRQETQAFDEPRVLARAVADHGEFVEIRRPSDDQQLICGARGLDRSAPVELNYFVHRDDLALTVHNRAVYDHDDGTEIELLPGSPLEPRDRSVDQYRSGDEEFDFTVQVPPEDLAPSFSPVDEWEKTNSGLRLDADQQLQLGEQVIESDEMVSMEVVDESSGEIFGRIARSCYRLTGRISSDEVDTNTLSITVGSECGAGAGYPGSPTHRAEAGIPVYWPEGDPAGEVIEEIEIYDEIAPDEDFFCKDHTLLGRVWRSELDIRASHEERTVEYCFDVDDLVEIDGEE